MADYDYLSTQLSESLLTAMAYVGPEASPLLATLLPEMFDGLIYQDIAARIIDYRLRFKEPPAPAHLDDIFDHVGRDDKNYKTYQRILVGMREQAPTLNIKYLVDRVTSFARSQNLKAGLIEANERYTQGGDDRDDEVEAILSDTLRNRVDTLDFGERLSEAPLDWMDRDEFEDGSQMPIGIPALDRRGIVPTRGELYRLMGNTGAGKSWWLQFLARQAARHNPPWVTVYISLENRRPRVKRRFSQMYASAAVRKEKYIIPLLEREDDKDKLSKLSGIDYKVMEPLRSFDDPRDRKEVTQIMNTRTNRIRTSRIIMKEWPGNTLTIPMLEHWLDALGQAKGIYPDMICLDMPQLMKLDPKDKRGSFGAITIDLRRIADERNLAMCDVLHSNREGEKSKVLHSFHAGEDISQAKSADVLLTFNQTEQERRLGLARLFTEKVRNDESKSTILLTQSYKVGQFMLDSAPMSTGSYWDFVNQVDDEAKREKLTSADYGSYDDERDAADD